MILLFELAAQRPINVNVHDPRPEAVAALAPVPTNAFEGSTTADGDETAPCIFQPGTTGMVKVELTCGEKAKIVLKTAKGSNELTIRAGNTLLLMLPADGSLSLLGTKAEPLEVHWIFSPKR